MASTIIQTTLIKLWKIYILEPLHTISYHGDLSRFKMFCETKSQDWNQSQWANALILLCETWTNIIHGLLLKQIYDKCLHPVIILTTSILFCFAAITGQTDLHRSQMTNYSVNTTGIISNISSIDPISATRRHLPKTVNNYHYIMQQSQFIT